MYEFWWELSWPIENVHDVLGHFMIFGDLVDTHMFRKGFLPIEGIVCILELTQPWVQSQNEISTFEFGKSIGSSFTFKDFFFSVNKIRLCCSHPFYS